MSMATTRPRAIYTTPQAVLTARNVDAVDAAKVTAREELHAYVSRNDVVNEILHAHSDAEVLEYARRVARRKVRER